MAAEAEAGSAQVLNENAVFPPPQRAGENPFLVVEPEPRGDNEGGGGEDDSPAPAVSPLPARRAQPPPTYNEAVRRPTGLRNTADSSLVDVTPLLSRQSSMSSVAAREPSIGDHVRQQRGVTRAILLWLGVGQWYSGLCIFFSFLFFFGGGVLVVLSFLTLDKLQPVKLTVVAAGVVFVLVSLLWPCGWLWNQWNKTCGCSFAPFLAYTWALSLVYTAIVGALIFGVNEHYSCIHFCNNCTFPMDERYPCQFVQMSLWTLVAMIALMIAVVFITFCYCCCNCSCRKQRRGYSML